ncbi:MAG: cation diffusion facilitator family transporter [Rhodothermaceae bacterium]
MSHDHSHSHSHSHDHSHSFDPGNVNKAFLYGIILNVIYIVVEAGYGLAINSMALLADAGHNLSDVLGLILAWIASKLAQTAITEQRTFGMRKATILAALLNGIILLIAVGGIAVEATRKIMEPEPVVGSTVMIVAGIGVVINTLTALMFVKGKEKDINIRGAYLHMAADALVSVGVVLSGLVITLTDFFILDSIISFVIVIVITWGTWGLLKDSFKLSMDSVPENIDFRKVKEYLLNLPNVTDVHDLHIWPLSTTETALTVHLVRDVKENDDKFLAEILAKLKKDFEIDHATIQVENSECCSDCSLSHKH